MACSWGPSPSTRQVPGSNPCPRRHAAHAFVLHPPSLPSSFGDSFFRTFPTNPAKVLGLLINEQILPISSLTYQYFVKNHKIQRIFQRQFLKKPKSDLAEIWELSLARSSNIRRRHLLQEGCFLFNSAKTQSWNGFWGSQRALWLWQTWKYHGPLLAIKSDNLKK